MLGRANLVYGEGGPETYLATAHTIQNKEDLLRNVNSFPGEYKFMDAMMADGNKDIKPEQYFSPSASVNNNSLAREFGQDRSSSGSFNKNEKAAVAAVINADTRDPSNKSLLSG